MVEQPRVAVEPLPRNAINHMVATAAATLWSFTTDRPFAEVTHPAFLSRLHDAVRAGDQVLFSAGPPDARVHGTMVVTGIGPQVANQPRLVHTEVLARTREPASRKLRVV
jgi:hypothetical protein